MRVAGHLTLLLAMAVYIGRPEAKRPCKDINNGCRRLGRSRPASRCYRRHTISRCCETCQKLRNDLAPSCPYGDTQEWCKSIGDRYAISSCYENEATCCETCPKVRSDIPGCPYGDKVLWCRHIGKFYSPDQCKGHGNETCCGTCRQLFLQKHNASVQRSSNEVKKPDVQTAPSSAPSSSASPSPSASSSSSIMMNAGNTNVSSSPFSVSSGVSHSVLPNITISPIITSSSPPPSSASLTSTSSSNQPHALSTHIFTNDLDSVKKELESQNTSPVHASSSNHSVDSNTSAQALLVHTSVDVEFTADYVSTTSNYDSQMSDYNTSVIVINYGDGNHSAISTEDFTLNDTLSIDSDGDVTKIEDDLIRTGSDVTNNEDGVSRTVGRDVGGVRNISQFGAPENPPYMNSESGAKGMAVEVVLLLNKTNVSKVDDEVQRPEKETTDDEDLLTDYGSGDDAYEDDYEDGEDGWSEKGGRRRNKGHHHKEGEAREWAVDRELYNAADYIYYDRAIFTKSSSTSNNPHRHYLAIFLSLLPLFWL